MKNKVISIILLVIVFVFSAHVQLVSAQTNRPALVLTPSGNVEVGAKKDIQLSLVNMGIPLRKVEVVISLSGRPHPRGNMSFTPLDTEQYGLAYKSHYAVDVAGRDDMEELTLVMESTSPDGYNQGSSQIPLVNISYTAVPGIFSATILSDKTKITDANGQVIPSVQMFGTSNYTADPTPQDIQSYSLSFESDPISKWWPTAPNSVQQLDAAIWKDSDGTAVKNFTNLRTDWQVDPNYLTVTDTSSSYFDQCPVLTVGNRPCIRFAAHIITRQTGHTGVKLVVTDINTGRQTWNAYPVEIFSVASDQPSPSVTQGMPTLTPIPTQRNGPSPIPTFYPENQVSTKELKDIQQKVTYLEKKVQNQQQQLEKSQSTLEKILSFLKRFFRF